MIFLITILLILFFDFLLVIDVVAVVAVVVCSIDFSIGPTHLMGVYSEFEVITFLVEALLDFHYHAHLYFVEEALLAAVEVGLVDFVVLRCTPGHAVT